MHLSSLGPVPCFLHPEAPQGAPFEGGAAAAVADGVMATTSFVTDMATYILCPQPSVGTPSPSPSPEPTTQLDPKKYAIGQSDLWGPGPPSAIEKTHILGSR